MIQKDHLKESLRYWNTRKLLHERNGYVAAGNAKDQAHVQDNV